MRTFGLDNRASRTKLEEIALVLGRGAVSRRNTRKIADENPFTGVDTVWGFANIPDPRLIQLRDAVSAALSLTSQQLECREDVSRRMSGTTRV